MTTQPPRARPAPTGTKPPPSGEDAPKQQPVPGVSEMVAEALAAQATKPAPEVEQDRVERLARVLTAAAGGDPDNFILGRPLWHEMLHDAKLAIAVREFFAQEEQEAREDADAS